MKDADNSSCKGSGQYTDSQPDRLDSAFATMINHMTFLSRLQLCTIHRGLTPMRVARPAEVHTAKGTATKTATISAADQLCYSLKRFIQFLPFVANLDA
jgi:hypothetical protein